MSILPWITPFLVRGHAHTLRGVSSKPRVFAGILQYFFIYRRDRRPLEVCVYSAIVLPSCLYSFEAHREWDLTQGQEQSPWFVLSYRRESTLVHLFTSGVSGKRCEKTCWTFDVFSRWRQTQNQKATDISKLERKCFVPELTCSYIVLLVKSYRSAKRTNFYSCNFATWNGNDPGLLKVIWNSSE